MTAQSLRDGAALAFERGVAACRSRDFAAALAAFRQALAAVPDFVEALNGMGVALRGLKQPAAAAEAYVGALRLAPGHAGLWSNLGLALKDLQRLESARACLDQALALSPGEAPFHHNRGLVLTWMNRHDAAIADFEAALRIAPDNAEVAWDLARARLHLGDYRRGWPESEARWRLERVQARPPGMPRWQGQAPAGRRILVTAEQGLGDTIWALRYLPLLAARGARIVLECQPTLMPLLDGLACPLELVPAGGPPVMADFHIPVMSLPQHFPDLAPETVARPPYLAAPAARAAPFQPLLAKAGGRLKVGIVWSGSTTFGENRFRALPMAALVAALSVPGVQLFSLQKGPPAAELAQAERSPVIDLAPLLDDFGDTAAAVAALDLVVMTDSGVAHLCGALGRPVWVLLPHYAYWLWLDRRPDSPWYPSMRLFRQPRPGDWASVLDQAGAALVHAALVHAASAQGLGPRALARVP